MRTDGCRGSRALDAVPVAEGVKTGHCPCGTRSLSLRHISSVFSCTRVADGSRFLQSYFHLLPVCLRQPREIDGSGRAPASAPPVAAPRKPHVRVVPRAHPHSQGGGGLSVASPRGLCGPAPSGQRMGAPKLTWSRGGGCICFSGEAFISGLSFPGRPWRPAWRARVTCWLAGAQALQVSPAGSAQPLRQVFTKQEENQSTF